MCAYMHQTITTSTHVCARNKYANKTARLMAYIGWAYIWKVCSYVPHEVTAINQHDQENGVGSIHLKTSLSHVNSLHFSPFTTTFI